jgi:membrane-associated phospholipid phosphatase
MAATSEPLDTSRPASALRVIAAASFAVFLLLAFAVPDRGGLAWDDAVLDALNALAPISSDEIHPDPELRAIVFLGTASAGLLALWLLLRGRWRSALFLVGSLAGTVALTTLTKAIVERRSIEGGAGESSFPSGTAAWAAALNAACVILAPSRFRLWVAGAGALGVLLYSAVITWEEWHYSTDVIGGWALAIGWVALIGSLLLPDRQRS